MSEDMIILFNTFVDMSRKYHIPIRRKDMERMMTTFADLFQELTEYVLPWTNKIQSFLNGDEVSQPSAKYSGVSWKHHAFDLLDEYITPKSGTPECLDFSGKNVISVCLNESWADCLGTVS